ncbi:hypothetical protein Golomagni_06203 [Golovinomyces magnicellulatus]|nr:hypothetical protein Golomagni_06203 [Golovinomyces magnicellulatus]
MLCFTLLTQLLGCTKGAKCNPGAYIFYTPNEAQIGRIYGETMLDISGQLEGLGKISIEDISLDRNVIANLRCTYGEGVKKVQKLMNELKVAADNNRQYHAKEIKEKSASYQLKPSPSSLRWLHSRRAFKTLPGKYDCVLIVSIEQNKVPPLKTRLPTNLRKITSEADFIVKTYRGNTVLVITIGMYKINILEKKALGIISYPHKKEIDTKILVVYMMGNFKVLQLAFILLRTHPNRGDYLTIQGLTKLPKKKYNVFMVLFKHSRHGYFRTDRNFGRM